MNSTRLLLASVWAFLGLLPGGCASLPVEDATTGPVVRIGGRVVYAEPTALPAGATLRVALQDLGRTDVEEAIVAYQDSEPSGRKWSDFLLQIPTDLIDPRRSYGLSARITDSQGRLLWVMDRVQPLSLNAPGAVELVVRRPGRLPSAPSVARNRTMSFDCQGLTVTVHVEKDRARVVLPDRTLVLNRVQGEAEQEYGEAGAKLRIVGNALFLELAGKVYRSCEPLATSDPPRVQSGDAALPCHVSKEVSRQCRGFSSNFPMKLTERHALASSSSP